MQVNKAMAPFCNKGWQYFEMLAEIMPNASVRGSHAFSAMNTTPPGAPEGNDDAEGVEARAASSSGQDSHTNNDVMEVNREGDVSTLISASTSKCKLTSDDDTTTCNSGSGGPPTNTSVTSVPSSTPSSEPSRKKIVKLTSSISTSSKLQLKRATSHHSKALTSVSSSSCSTKTISSDLLVHDMQESINMLTSTVHDSMDSDPVTKVHQTAVWLLQTQDDGLSGEQKIMLFHKFTNQHALTQTYLALDDKQLRRVWLQDLCK